MISFPNCKINLGLYITARRADGYHNLETVFFPLPLNDVLEMVPAPVLQFSLTGLPVIGTAENNLCRKAYDLMKRHHPELPSVHIHLHKLIPMGAGLGGGSADGAFMLNMLNDYFRLGHSREVLMDMAIELGSDCPFFILNQAAYGKGRGEQLEPVPINLSGWWLALVNPGIHVSTASAFAGIIPAPAPPHFPEGILEPPAHWKGWLHNVFEDQVFVQYPAIGKIKEDLYQSGAHYASMTGSGSSVFGFFTDEPVLDFPEHYLVKKVQIK